MPTTLFQQLFRRLHGLAGPSPLTDEALLADYVARRDQKAFELLVWRHGAMVLQTCQRIVRCPAEAEDAFQAVFWILARKAGTVRRGAALPGWLHRIAVRVALAAKRRRGKYTSLDAIDEPTSAPTEREPALDLLDEEINRLSLKYRLPIVLCHLEQKSSAEAAQELGIPPGTLFSRLARGREMLRARLQRRGVASVIGGSILLEQIAQAAPSCPVALVEKTIAGALAFAAARSGEMSAPVLALTKGVLHAMWLRNIAVWGASVVLVVIVSGAWFVLQPAAAQNQPAPVVQEPAKDNKLAKLLKDRYDRAAKVFELVRERYYNGRTNDTEILWRWSIKTLEAELDWKPQERIAAHLVHLERMQELHKMSKARVDVGAIDAVSFAFADHAVMEAELWLEREKAKKNH